MTETETRVRGNVQHGEGGKFVDKYSDDDVVQALLEANPEPLTNKEVSQIVGCSKPTAHNRLHELAEAGRVNTKKVGANARVWWVDPDAPVRDVEVGVAQLLKEDELERWFLIDLAGELNPEFNPTRTSSEDIVEYLLDQPWDEVTNAYIQVRNQNEE